MSEESAHKARARQLSRIVEILGEALSGRTPANKPPKNQTVMAAKQKNVTIEKTGDKIIIPENMSYADAREWLSRQEQAEETTFQVRDFIDCFPLDGIVALSRAIKSKYGFAELGKTDGWFGPEPPVIVQVPLANGEFESAPMGKIKPPKWEGGYLEPQINGPQITICGVLKKKFETEVKEIIAITRTLLREQSIYRGQAIELDLSWYDEDPKRFDPIRNAPKFIPASDCELILSRKVEFELGTSVYMILEQSKACKQNGIALKHGALFKGPYGTGKTLTAKKIAHKAVKNGWTFIYLRAASQLANGLRIAKMYAPAVVFAEDVDTVVADRDEGMNDLLNVLDGVDTKDNPIMVILTTNSPDVIDPSFLRAGRIDTVVHFGPPDAETAVRFVKHFGGKLIADGEDLTAVGASLEGLVSAFVCEAVSKAKRYAIYRTGSTDITGVITADDLLQAAESVKDHIKMMEKKGVTDAEAIANSLRMVHHYGVSGQLLALGNGRE